MKVAWLAPLALLAACASPVGLAECPSGTLRVEGACQPACSRDDQCAFGERCQLPPGVCVAGVPSAADAGTHTNADAGPSADAAAPPVPVPGPRGAREVSGGGEGRSARYTLRVGVGGPAPAGTAATRRYRVSLGAGVHR